MDDQQRTVCAHCGSRDLLEVAATPSQHSHIVVTARARGGGAMRTVRVCKYVCTDCGRIEEWVHGADDLTQLKAELLGEPETGGDGNGGEGGTSGGQNNGGGGGGGGGGATGGNSGVMN